MSTAKVANGQPTDASQFNGLVDDVWDAVAGHNHTGVANQGKKVSHTNLTDGAITGGIHAHAAIDAHIGSTAGSGSTGVHGLAAGVAVQGNAATAPYVFDYGVLAGEGPATVTTNLSTIVGVLATAQYNADAGDGMAGANGVHPVVWGFTPVAGASTFRLGAPHEAVSNPGHALAIYWLAWGTK